MKWTVERDIYNVESRRERTDRHTSDDGRFKIYDQPKFLERIRKHRLHRQFIGRVYIVEERHKPGSVDFPSLANAKEWCLFQTGERRHRQDFPYRFVIEGEDAPSAVWLKMLLKARRQWIDWRLEVVAYNAHDGRPIRTVVWFLHDVDAVAFRMHFPAAIIEKPKRSDHEMDG